MKQRSLILLIWFTTLWASFVSAVPSLPCTQLISEVALWGIALDPTLQLTPGPAIRRPFHAGLPAKWIVPSYTEASFHLTAENVEAVAERLAIDHPVALLREGLAKNTAAGFTEIPLVPFLPKRVQAQLNRPGSIDCYHAALNFNELVSRSINVDRELDGKYITLTRGDVLRFGDIILFRGYPNAQGRSVMFHSAVYLGGDLVYHKLNPIPIVPHDITSIEALYRLYSDREMGRLQAVSPIGDSNPFRYGEPFVMQFMRYRR